MIGDDLTSGSAGTLKVYVDDGSVFEGTETSVVKIFEFSQNKTRSTVYEKCQRYHEAKSLADIIDVSVELATYSNDLHFRLFVSDDGFETGHEFGVYKQTSTQLYSGVRTVAGGYHSCQESVNFPSFCCDSVVCSMNFISDRLDADWADIFSKNNYQCEDTAYNIVLEIGVNGVPSCNKVVCQPIFQRFDSRTETCIDMWVTIVNLPQNYLNGIDENFHGVPIGAKCLSTNAYQAIYGTTFLTASRCSEYDSEGKGMWEHLAGSAAFRIDAEGILYGRRRTDSCIPRLSTSHWMEHYYDYGHYAGDEYVDCTDGTWSYDSENNMMRHSSGQCMSWHTHSEFSYRQFYNIRLSDCHNNAKNQRFRLVREDLMLF